MTKTAALLTATLLLTLAGTAPAEAGGDAPPGDPPCPGFQHVPGTGPACLRANGLYEVFSRPDAQGRRESLGFTHGRDAESGHGPAVPSAPRPVWCVSGAPGTYYTQVIYARAQDDADNYAASVPSIQSVIEAANGLLHDAAAVHGGSALLRVKCVMGVIEVKNEVLPTLMANADFSSIVTDLRAKGYTDPRVKYWVYYDEGPGGGQGHVNPDDRLALDNANNGEAMAMFAISYKSMTARVFLHELAHNMGAVQKSAPHSTDDPNGNHPNGWHCYDGHDTMCYNDGAPRGHLYATTYCAVEVFDCGKDDYFHRDPPAGSYLATHWNLGNPLNRFIYFSFGDATAPSVPTGLTSTGATQNSISLSWNAATDNVLVDHYRVYRGTDPALLVQVGTSRTPAFTDAGLNPGTLYHYRVSAVDEAGNEGGRSDPYSQITTDTQAPSKVQNVRATGATETSISLAWDAAIDDAGVDHYRVYRGTSSTSLAFVGTAPGTSHTDGGLAPWTVYYYRVSAVDVGGNQGPLSDVISHRTLDTTAPTRPTGLQVTGATSTTVTLSWTASTDNAAVTGYRIHRGPDPNLVSPVGLSPTTSHTDTGLQVHTTYYYRVSALDAAGNEGPLSDAVAAWTPDTTPPAQVTGLRIAAVSSTTASLAWSAASDNVGVMGYRVYRGADAASLALHATVSGTGFADGSLTASTTYHYAVAAVDAAGNEGARSSTLAVTTSDGTPPVLSVSDPAPGYTYVGCTRSEHSTTSPTTYAGAGCVKGWASDPETGLGSVEVYEDGVLVASTAATNFELTWTVRGAPGDDVTVLVVARNGFGIASEWQATVRIGV